MPMRLCGLFYFEIGRYKFTSRAPWFVCIVAFFDSSVPFLIAVSTRQEIAATVILDSVEIVRIVFQPCLARSFSLSTFVVE